MVVAYLRVSTEKQNLENQKDEVMRYVAVKNLCVDHWVEETVSGTKDKDERELGGIISKLNQGDTLIVTEVSRLSRSLHEIMEIMKYCMENGITIYSTKEGYEFDDSLNSKVLSFAFGLAAEIEHQLISQRTREALAMRKASGKPIGRKRGSDYLYQKSSQNTDAILEAIAQGLTIKKICSKLSFSRNIFEKLRANYPDIDRAIKKRNTEHGNRWG